MTVKSFKLVQNKNKFNEFDYAGWPDFRGIPRKFTVNDVPNLNISAALKNRLNSLRPGTFVKIGKLCRGCYIYVIVDDGQTVEQTLGPNILRRNIRNLNLQIAKLEAERQLLIDECNRRGLNY